MLSLRSRSVLFRPRVIAALLLAAIAWGSTFEFTHHHGATSQQLASRVTELTNYLVTRGFSGPDAATAAQAYLYQQFQHQVSLLSFMDCFRVIAWLTLAAVPLLLFVRRFKPAGKAPTTH